MHMTSGQTMRPGKGMQGGYCAGYAMEVRVEVQGAKSGERVPKKNLAIKLHQPRKKTVQRVLSFFFVARFWLLQRRFSSRNLKNINYNTYTYIYILYIIYNI